MEYDVLVADSLPNGNNLNDLAKDGWQLVQIIKDNGRYYVYIQRQTTH